MHSANISRGVSRLSVRLMSNPVRGLYMILIGILVFIYMLERAAARA